MAFKNPSMEEMQRILHQPFDADVHVENFINYLEVIIRNDGTIEYAVPSHVMKLREIYGKTAEQIFDEFMESGCVLDPAEYLCQKTGCISVWNSGYVGHANDKQLESLRLLKSKGIYEGVIEK